ncbi:S41 family peptidase [Janthinobacterium sp. RA13]|uniref:S41 family peptidase n=1 Tax=Janthinobacterium sp. RA13 TaxID=1502762 RepID=UPI00068B4E26|nr:S41 family peptidase [Janthinobacterium sp. RA13]
MPAIAFLFVATAPPAFSQDGRHTAFETDHAFDAGSRIALDAVTPAQVDNLAVLGKVWGFLKYHHPLITAGGRQWDYELLRVMPKMLDAPDRAAGDAVLRDWIAGLGPLAGCDPCAVPAQGELHLRPALQWMDDASLLGAGLRADLRYIYLHRPASASQFYLRMQEQVGNPVFEHEPAYPDLALPDAGFQLLALFRFWNIIEYWAPYRDLTGENWDDVLRQSLPRIALARDRASYQLEMMAVIARLHDTHTNLWSSMHVRPPVGQCRLPVKLRFIGTSAVVVGYREAEAGAATRLQVGDVIDSVDGVPVAQLVATWRPHYAASNEAARLRDMAGRLTAGACGAIRLQVRRGQQAVELTAQRVPAGRQAGRQAGPDTHDREGGTFQRLGDDIAYLKLSSLKRADVAAHMAAAAGSRGLIIDLRNYPREFVVFALGAYLVERPTAFARFTKGDLGNPGAFHWTQPVALYPQAPRYAGKVMLLVDEVSQSQAEYTAMALRVAPRAKVVGSTTAGADGNISTFSLPGGLSTLISGIGVFYPDRRPTQRVGIIPDIEVRPTLAGIRAGRDEVLEAAIAEIRRQ